MRINNLHNFEITKQLKEKIMRINYDRIASALGLPHIIRELDRAREHRDQYNEYQRFYKGGLIDKVSLADFIDWRRVVGIDYIKAKLSFIPSLVDKNKQKVKYYIKKRI